MANLASNLAGTARAHTGRVAVRVGEATTTYTALDQASARVAGLLGERGFKPGDRAGIMLPNVAEFAVVYYGVLRAGGVVVPMNPLLKAREVAYCLGDSGAAVIGLPYPALGEEVGAAVTLKPGADLTAGELHDDVKAQGRGVQVPAPCVVRRSAAEGSICRR